MSKKTKLTKRQKAEKLWLIRAMDKIMEIKRNYYKNLEDPFKVQVLPPSEKEKLERRMIVSITIPKEDKQKYIDEECDLDYKERMKTDLED